MKHTIQHPKTHNSVLSVLELGTSDHPSHWEKNNSDGWTYTTYEYHPASEWLQIRTMERGSKSTKETYVTLNGEQVKALSKFLHQKLVRGHEGTSA